MEPAVENNLTLPVSKKLPGVGIIAYPDALKKLAPAVHRAGFEICGVWGRTKEDAENAANIYNIAFCSCRVDDVLLSKEVELVFVDLQPSALYPVVKKVLGIGKHVVLSSPIGLNLSQIEELIEAAEYYPSLISVVCWPMQFHPAVVKLRELVNSGYVGMMQSMQIHIHTGSLTADTYDWRCDSRTGGGALNLLAAQAVDVLQLLSGSAVTRVSSVLRTFRTRTNHVIRHVTADDFCSLQMRLSADSCATVTVVSSPHQPHSLQIHILGSKGHLRFEQGEINGSNGEKEELLERLSCEDWREETGLQGLLYNVKQSCEGETQRAPGELRHRVLCVARVITAARESVQQDSAWVQVKHPKTDLHRPQSQTMP